MLILEGFPANFEFTRRSSWSFPVVDERIPGIVVSKLFESYTVLSRVLCPHVNIPFRCLPRPGVCRPAGQCLLQRPPATSTQESNTVTDLFTTFRDCWVQPPALGRATYPPSGFY